ncbi:M29 family metallopeptidase [Desulforhopalus sp. 52FAK]
MQGKLNAQELKELVDSVFSLTHEDRHLLFIVDIPDDILPDTDAWRIRRGLAEEWCRDLQKVQDTLGLESVRLLAYPNVHSNNANLPEWGVFIDSGLTELTGERFAAMKARVNFKEVLTQTHIVIAPTQLSTTAPLKLLSRQLTFRAATMPGFSPNMIPALRIDYREVNRRVDLITKEISLAKSLDVQFTVDSEVKHTVHFDLRHRQGHASGGRFPTMGMAGNLPSGESYIVPYEGELEDISESIGTLPVQFEEEVVVYRIERNKAIEVLTEGPHSTVEAQRILSEPAYANISELGFGVLKDFGLHPTGVTLLDEKLGLHIAFGRSDHFGGSIGVKDFSSPEAVVHIDRIYIPETAPRIHVDSVTLSYADDTMKNLMLNGNYTIF